MAYKDKTHEQKLNINTLHDGLVGMYGDERADSHFCMDYYQYEGNHTETELKGLDFFGAFTEHNRNTSACVLGHGPIFCIKGNNQFGWCAYGLECFGVDEEESFTEWKFLFSGIWTDDIQEAIARLRMYINGFDPENEDWDFNSRYSV